LYDRSYEEPGALGQLSIEESDLSDDDTVAKSLTKFTSKRPIKLPVTPTAKKLRDSPYEGDNEIEDFIRGAEHSGHGVVDPAVK
jgi:hypothetical protein